MTIELKERLVRPVKCYFCNQSLFYAGDERHEPEVRVVVECTTPDHFDYGFYAHVRCWNARMKSE